MNSKSKVSCLYLKKRKILKILEKPNRVTKFKKSKLIIDNQKSLIK